MVIVIVINIVLMMMMMAGMARMVAGIRCLIP